MARLAVTVTLILSLFLLSYARLQHNQPENQVVEWNQLPSTSNGRLVPDSASKSAILPSDHLTDSQIEPYKILLPAEEVAESEATGAVSVSVSVSVAVAPPGSDAVTVFSDDRLQPQNLVVEWIPDSVSESELDVAELQRSDSIAVAPLTEPSEISTSSNNEHSHHGFHFHFYFNFHFRFPFGFRFHSDCHHQKKDKHEEEKMEKQFEPSVAGEEIPNGDDMVMARTARFLPGKVHHHDPVGDGEEMMRYEEGKMKRHNKESKKEKEDCEGMRSFEEGSKMKRHKKEWKKEKKDDEEMLGFEEGSKMKRHKKEWKKEKKDDEEMLGFEEGSKSKMKRHKKEWKKEKENDDDDDEMLRFEEGKMKRHKEWKKEKEDDDDDDEMLRFEEGKTNRHKKEWKKRKEDACLMKLFRKSFKKFFKLFD